MDQLLEAMDRLQENIKAVAHRMESLQIQTVQEKESEFGPALMPTGHVTPMTPATMPSGMMPPPTAPPMAPPMAAHGTATTGTPGCHIRRLQPCQGRGASNDVPCEP